jgi:prophage antirepressor-like protein
VIKEDKPLFCAIDVAKILGYSNQSNAISTHCRGALKRGTPTSSGDQEMLFIPESDVYRLIMRSKLPDAERFQD